MASERRLEHAVSDRRRAHVAILDTLRSLQAGRTLCRRCTALPATRLHRGQFPICDVCAHAERHLTPTQRAHQRLTESRR